MSDNDELRQTAQTGDSAIIDRARRPHSETFTRFMTQGWDQHEQTQLRVPSRAHTVQRRARLAEAFPGEWLVLPAGPLKIRSNDLTYPYRPHTAFAYYTGLGEDHEPNAVLVIRATADSEDTSAQATLFLQPPADSSTKEFYTSPAFGEYWIGSRPTLRDFELATGIETRPLSELIDELEQGATTADGLRVIREADPSLTETVDAIRRKHGVVDGSALDAELHTKADEARFIKDPTEVAEIREAVAATAHGLNRVVEHLSEAIDQPHGERILEGWFSAHSRVEGNGMPGAIFAAGEHTPILHWMRNTGDVHDGDLLLIDTGVESRGLYAADISRTLPVNGRFTPIQRKIYDAVLEAQLAAFEVIRPGHRYYEIHDTCMRIIAEHLHDWGILPCSVEESLDPHGQQHRRWLACGVGHHLGLDVHDCSHASKAMYWGSEFTPGMVLTIEPGLYFRKDDLMVPPEYRGIGVRIEDDVVVTEDGAEWLSSDIPRTADDVERWVTRSLR